MREYERKKNIKRVLYSPLLLIVLALLVLFMAKATWSVYAKKEDSRQRFSRAAAALNSLKERHDALAEKLERLKTPEGVEAEIREQFQVARPGERMVIVVESTEKPAPAPQEPSLVSKFFDIFR